jgi:predicted RNA-binding Zn-ribbon protein involved in translation (DUF1610 family)
MEKKFKTIKCPKCGGTVEIDIARAVDEEGEVFVCPECGFQMRYTEKIS